jgi:RNA polymerase sigma-70 factor (ECF subfamily)
MKGRMTGPIPLRTAEAIGDPELVARALGGDRWSREMIYRRHASSLLGMTIRLISNRDEAEEIVQDTFVTGFEQLATLREPAALRAWLGQIAVRLVHARIRRRRMLRLFGLDRGAEDATLAALAAPDLPADQRTDLALLDRVLASLRAPIRIAWMLRRVEGLELTEVAAMTGCSLATVKRRIAEAEAVVRQHVSVPEEVTP